MVEVATPGPEFETVVGKIREQEFDAVVEKIRVLIVDDDDVVVHGLRSILQAHDDVDVVGEAATRPDLNEMLQQTTADLILLDDETLGPDTVGAVRQVKRDHPGVGILLMSVHDTYVGAALDAGADAFIMKDAPRHDLLRMIRRVAAA